MNGLSKKKVGKINYGSYNIGIRIINDAMINLEYDKLQDIQNLLLDYKGHLMNEVRDIVDESALKVVDEEIDKITELTYELQLALNSYGAI